MFIIMQKPVTSFDTFPKSVACWDPEMQSAIISTHIKTQHPPAELLGQGSEDTSPGIVTSGALDFGEAAMVAVNVGPTKHWAELAELTCGAKPPSNIKLFSWDFGIKHCIKTFLWEFYKFKIGNGRTSPKLKAPGERNMLQTIHSPAVQGRN